MTSFEQKKANALEKAAKKIEELKKELAKAELGRSPTPLAIVGIGCHFPGGANSPEAFWENLVKGHDGISEVPIDRWNADSYFSPDPDAPGKINSKKGGFLTSDVAMFDANFFGISDIEAQSMDPQHRLLLEITWQALENAAINPQSLKGTSSGIYIGTSTNDYGNIFAKQMPEDKVNAYLGIGNSFSILAGRVAYILGTHGPAIGCDTSCSSSLVAMHLACKALIDGETDLSIAGGVNLILSPQNSIFFTKAKMLSEDGHCKSFDSRADGYSRGEGCGVVIIKRLNDALQANDRILCLIKGSAINQNGDSSGLTVPNPKAQQQVIRQALKNSNLTPKDIDVIEAHGTGIALGDSLEMEAIKCVFSNRDHPLTIGSVKTNIGHLESASGIAGIIKVILSLENEKIPKHLNFNIINPLIDLKPFKGSIPTKIKEWRKNKDRIRRAGVSSYGMNGTNAHIILEEAPENKGVSDATHDCFLFCFSAKSAQALENYLKAFITFLDNPINNKLNPGDISLTLNTGRGQYKHRFVIIASSLFELRRHLKNNHSLLENDLKKMTTPEAKKALEFIQGQQVNFDSLYTYEARKIPLPYYVFQKKRYWHNISPTPVAISASDKSHLLLSSPSYSHSHQDKPSFEERLKNTEKHNRNNLLTDELKKIVAGALFIDDEQTIHEHSEFIEFGVDSLMAVNLFNGLKAMVGIQYTLSKSLLIECTSIARLSEYFKENVFVDLFDKPIRALNIAPKPTPINREVTLRKPQKKSTHSDSLSDIFLTGATGTLGGYLTKLILEDTEISLHCLIRARNEAHAFDRLRHILEIFQTKESVLKNLENRVQVYCGDISSEHFSLSPQEYHHLTNITDLTIHSAARVSLRDSYEDLYDSNVLGTKNIFKFALETQEKSLIYISSYSIMGDIQTTKNLPFKESDFDLGQNFRDMGYQKTKFESERLIREARKNGLKWRIIRPGDIFGDAQNGCYPLASEITPSVFYDLFKTVTETSVAAISHLHFDITPVDYVAKGILHIALKEKDPFATYHLTNPDVKTFSEVIQILCDLGYPIELISTDEYIKRVYTRQLKHNGRVYQSLTTSMVQYHAAKIIPEHSTPVDATKTKQLLAKAGIRCPKADKKLLSTLLLYCIDKGYISAPKPLSVS